MTEVERAAAIPRSNVCFERGVVTQAMIVPCVCQLLHPSVLPMIVSMLLVWNNHYTLIHFFFYGCCHQHGSASLHVQSITRLCKNNHPSAFVPAAALAAAIIGQGPGCHLHTMLVSALTKLRNMWTCVGSTVARHCSPSILTATSLQAAVPRLEHAVVTCSCVPPLLTTPSIA